MQIDAKTKVLFNFYLSIRPQSVVFISQIPALGYAWIYADRQRLMIQAHVGFMALKWASRSVHRLNLFMGIKNV
ncbi:MAG: hypothetical protein V7L25_03165 [Nostoc sp.]|uniref:hypothetical protein n=1 Tax=Nostoc sp. TaxID=1180 RepID=UPI002FF0C65E